ncbi:HD domain-containing protein [Porphyrobacter sp. GA68]|uniref:HD domain-containing protein n=1 Tax=Porphyrobacter sp. GA68 TaxID=2883480 RepID=UPI001D1844D9|nr:HD domain-containing protein [Porphyrobacter sp. GA68]
MTLAPELLPLLRELGDLKRIRSAGRDGTVATRLFEAGWSAWLAGGSLDSIAARALAQGLAAARLGDLDYVKLGELGLAGGDRIAVLQRAIDAIAGPLDADLVLTLKDALAEPLDAAGALPHPIAALRDQPRAGVTGPGRPRIMLQPEENHAEHSFVVALYAGLLAPFYAADPAHAFWHGMIHHLHSSAMPDAGYAGEVLLQDRLDQVIERARALALAQLDEGRADICREHLAEIAADSTAAARAFHAGDVIDRVIEIEQHLKRSAVTMTVVLDQYGLVHDGPVKPFHDIVLREIGLP